MKPGDNMKLCNLSLMGFRSFKALSWSPGNLNLIIGQNGSGKSNLLKFFELLRRSADGKLEDHILREGGLEQILWDSQAENLTINLGLLLDADDNHTIPKSLKYSLIFNKMGVEGDYKITQEILSCSNNTDTNKDTIELFERSLSKSNLNDGSGKKLLSINIVPNETILSQYSHPLVADYLASTVQRSISSWRIFQSFDTSPDSPIRKPAISRRDTTLSWDGSNLISVLHTLYTTNREFERSIDYAMVAAFGEDYEKLVFPPAADKQIQLRIRWRTLKQERPASDISDGTLRYLFLLTILAHPEPGSLIAIDEPETGLHPAMMRIIAEYADEMSKRTQVVITTHSAEFLTACGGFVPSTFVIEWREGASLIHQISDEKLKFWMEDYTLGSLFSSGELEGMK